MGVRRGLVWLLCMMLAGLSACSSDGETPEADPTPTASESTSESASADTSPSIPPEAQGTDEKSAKAFVRFYFETLSEAMNSGDPRALSELATKNCASCSSFEELIIEGYADGGSIQSEGWTVKRFARLSGRKAMAFDVQARTGAEKFLDSDGHVARSFGGGARAMSIRLRPHETSWRMDRLVVLQ